MIGLIQRVTEARVEVDNRTVAQIDRGILALIGVEKQDESVAAQRLAQRIIQYRIFPDAG
ncbi:MAG: D-tyrosyl-tRNA(Tyr) deacylase, partial [Gammaproteobacteria bacterium]|nr:D-tyrosyl-tRNA(Tyr) deacylase [Gammaproteobacteria bacterium]